jgi:hypothetical protein
MRERDRMGWSGWTWHSPRGGLLRAQVPDEVVGLLLTTG